MIASRCVVLRFAGRLRNVCDSWLCMISSRPTLRRLISNDTREQRRTTYDPTTRRPNQICDPYGQGGKPLSAADAKAHKLTIHNDWQLVTTTTITTTTNNTHNQNNNNDSIHSDDKDSEAPPAKLVRVFRHDNFLSGAKFLEKIAAVAFVNNHYPLLELDRIIVRKQWHNISRISCRTTVLDGLSANDFLLAMMIDVETNRPEVQSLYIRDIDPKER